MLAWNALWAADMEVLAITEKVSIDPGSQASRDYTTVNVV